MQLVETSLRCILADPVAFFTRAIQTSRSEHPVQTLRKGRFASADTIAGIQEVTGYVRILGWVVAYHTHKTKKGDMMAFVTVEDETGQIDLAVMSDTFARQRELILEGTLLYVQGKKDRPGSVLVRSMEKVQPTV